MSSYFLFNVPATTEIYTLSLHDALPISGGPERRGGRSPSSGLSELSGRSRSVASTAVVREEEASADAPRSEEHTSELQSRRDLVCRLLLEKKKYHTDQCFEHHECSIEHD